MSILLTECIRVTGGVTRRYYLAVRATPDVMMAYAISAASWWTDTEGRREMLELQPEGAPAVFADTVAEAVEAAYAIRDQWRARVEAQS